MRQLNQPRILVAIAILAAILAATVLVAPRLVSHGAIRAQIEQRFLALTGREVTFSEEPKFLLTPLPHIVVRNLSVAGTGQQPEKAVLQISQLIGRVSLGALLRGKLEIAEYELIRPKLRVFIDGGGNLTWPGAESALAGVLRQAKSLREATAPNEKVDFSGLARIPVGQFTIVDGTLEFQSLDSAKVESATNLGASIFWDNFAAPLSVSGNVIFRNEKLDFSLRSENPLAFAAGAASTGELKLNCGAFAFSFAGAANMISGLHASGKASLSSASLRRLLSFLQFPVEPGATFGEFAASGNLSATPAKYELQDANVGLDGNKARGVVLLSVGANQRPQINGTLAFSVLDLTPYWNAARQETLNPSGDLGAFDMLDLMESDLRISVPSGKLGALSIADLAASIVLRNSELSFDVGNATLFGGTLMGKFSIVRKGGLVTMQTKASLDGYALAEAMKLVPSGAFRLTGTTRSSLQALSSGKTISELMERFAGEISLKTGPGALSGIDLAAIAAASAKAKPSDAITLGGATDYANLTASLFFDRSHLWLSELRLNGPKASALVSGRTDFSSGGLALQVSSRGTATPGASANMFIGGVLGEPLASRYPSFPQ